MGSCSLKPMQDIHKLTLLREFREIEAVLKTTAQQWHFPLGVIAFPDAICPFCRATLKSHKIWKVKKQVLVASWSFEGGKLCRTDFPRHPHVNHGVICMGNQGMGSEASALFLGLNPSSSYMETEHWNNWLRENFMHVCSAL